MNGRSKVFFDFRLNKYVSKKDVLIPNMALEVIRGVL